MNAIAGQRPIDRFGFKSNFTFRNGDQFLSEHAVCFFGEQHTQARQQLRFGFRCV